MAVDRCTRVSVDCQFLRPIFPTTCWRRRGPLEPVLVSPHCVSALGSEAREFTPPSSRQRVRTQSGEPRGRADAEDLGAAAHRPIGIAVTDPGRCTFPMPASRRVESRAATRRSPSGRGQSCGGRTATASPAAPSRARRRDRGRCESARRTRPARAPRGRRSRRVSGLRT